MQQVGSTVGLGLSCFGLSKLSSLVYSTNEGPGERTEIYCVLFESLCVPGMVSLSEGGLSHDCEYDIAQPCATQKMLITHVDLVFLT